MPTPDPSTRARLTVPSRGEAIAAAATQAIGGPVGRYAAIGRQGATWAAVVLGVLASAVVALGALQKGHCVGKGWRTPEAFWRTCYSDLPMQVQASGGPWGEQQAQPALTALLQWVLRVILPQDASVAGQRTYFTVASLVLVVCVVATVVAVARGMRRTPWLAAHVALSPVLMIAALVSFDLFGVALATLGLVAWMHRRPWQAGILLGLAFSARSYPALFLLAVVLIALRDRELRMMRDVVLGFLATVAGLVTIVVVSGGDVLAPYREWLDQGPGYGSVLRLFTAFGADIGPGAATVTAVVGWVLAACIGLYLVARPARMTPLAPLCLTLVVVVSLTGKALTAQQGVWLLPLIALCAMYWRDHLIWAGLEVTYFFVLWMYIAGPSNAGKGPSSAIFAVFTVARLVAWAGVAWTSWVSAEELQDFHDPEGAAAAEAKLQRELSTSQGRDSEIVAGPA